MEGGTAAGKEVGQGRKMLGEGGEARRKLHLVALIRPVMGAVHGGKRRLLGRGELGRGLQKRRRRCVRRCRVRSRPQRPWMMLV